MSALLIDAPKAAGLLGISEAHLWNRLAAGSIPRPVKIGRRALWRVEELRDWIAAGCPENWRWQGEKK